MAHEPGPGRLREVDELVEMPFLPEAGPAPPVRGFHHPGQKGVEADDEPLVDVERPEEGRLHAVPGLSERLHESNGHCVLLPGFQAKFIPCLMIRGSGGWVQGAGRPVTLCHQGPNPI